MMAEEELKEKALGKLKKALDTLDKKHGIDADGLLKVLEDDGPEALKKVIDGLKEQTPTDVWRQCDLTSVSISLSVYTFSAFKPKTFNGDVKPPAEPKTSNGQISPQDELDKLLFEVDEKTKEDSAEALRIAEETQLKLAEFEILVAQRKLAEFEILALQIKEQVQELKASDARAWDAIEKLQNPQE